MRKRALGAPKQKWTAAEEEALKAGVEKCVASPLQRHLSAAQFWGTGRLKWGAQL